VNATVIGDANQDGNSSNDRLPGARRNSFVGPNYTTTDMRVSRRLYAKQRTPARIHHGIVQSFQSPEPHRFQITDDGIMSNTAQFNYGTKHIGINYFPAYYRVPTNLLRATSGYAPRQLQFALRFAF
jgi:hypothetical protein